MADLEGLYGKYIIRKADGSPIDPKAKYIVLRYDADSKDFGPSHAAIRKYAEEIKQSNPVFALDLTKELDREYLKRLLAQTAN
jgi:hypothetical protein